MNFLHASWVYRSGQVSAVMLSSVRFLRFAKGFNAFKTDTEFKERAADAFFSLADQISAKYESMGDDVIIDVQDEAMAVTVKRQQILASRQTPSRQIWVAGPISGSLKFDFDTDKEQWIEHRDPASELGTCLNKEVETILGVGK